MTVCKNNINPLYNNYFRLTFSRGTSQFELMCQRVTLPGLSIGETKQPTTLGTTIPIPTLAANFEPLKVDFIVDNDLTNWKSIYSWMRNISNIDNVIPTSLGGLAFQTDNSDVNLVKCNASFAYSYYTMIPDANSDLSTQI